MEIILVPRILQNLKAHKEPSPSPYNQIARRMSQTVHCNKKESHFKLLLYNVYAIFQRFKIIKTVIF